MAFRCGLRDFSSQPLQSRYLSFNGFGTSVAIVVQDLCFCEESSKRGNASRRPRCRNNERSVLFKAFRLSILNTYIPGRRQQFRFIQFHTIRTASRFGGGTHALPFPSRRRIALVSSVRTIINRLLLAQRVRRWRPVRVQISDRVFAL